MAALLSRTSSPSLSLLCACYVVASLLLLAQVRQTHQQGLSWAFQVTENTPVGRVIGKLFEDTGSKMNFRFEEDMAETSYCILSQYFRINESTSEIYVHKELDREEIVRNSPHRSDNQTCAVRYSELDVELVPQVKQQTVFIAILDENDEEPHFYEVDKPVHYETICSQLHSELEILRLQPVDEDNGDNGTVYFHIAAGNDQGYFRIGSLHSAGDDDSGGMMAASTKGLLLNSETPSPGTYNLTIFMSDMGTPSKSYNQYIVIIVPSGDGNSINFSPSEYSAEVPEDTQLSVPFQKLNLQISDGDGASCGITKSSNVTFAFTVIPDCLDCFDISSDGSISLRRSIDYDTEVYQKKPENGYILSISAAYSTSTDTATSTVIITDVNEAPYLKKLDLNFDNTIADSPYEPIVISENMPSTELPVMIAYAIEDDDSNPTNGNINENDLFVTFDPPGAISVENSKITFHEIIGEFILISINQSLDREFSPTVVMMLQVSDTGIPPLTVHTNITINITDVNDNPPKFIEENYHVTLGSESISIGRTVVTVKASDYDEGINAAIAAYWIESVSNPVAQDWFNITDPSSGMIVVSSDLDYEAVGGEVTLTVKAVDSGTEPLSSSAYVHVTIAPPIHFGTASYHLYQGYSILEELRKPQGQVLIEVKTELSSGVILYEQETNTGEEFLLEIVNRTLVLHTNKAQTTIAKDATFANNEWFTVHIQSQENNSIAMSVDKSPSEVLPPGSQLLEAAILTGCDNNINRPNPQHQFYLGGQNVLRKENYTTGSDFNGCIRNLVIGSAQLDLRCPAENEATTQGCRGPKSCTGEESGGLKCEGPTAECLELEDGPHCSYPGGFLLKQETEQTAFTPIGFGSPPNRGPATIDLGYQFFYDLHCSSGKKEEAVDSGNGRADGRCNSGVDQQVIQVSFRPMDVSKEGIILHSETSALIHQLTYEPTTNSHSVVYKVSTLNGKTVLKQLPLSLEMRNETLYTVTIILNTFGPNVTLTSETDNLNKAQEWENGDYLEGFLAYGPTTRIMLGMAVDEHREELDFTGCVTALSIDAIQIPLSTAVEGNVISDCSICSSEFSPCKSDKVCVVNTNSTGHTCECVSPDDKDCQTDPVVTLVPSIVPSVVPSEPIVDGKDSMLLPLYALVAISVSALILISVTLCVVMTVVVKVTRRKKEEQHTYRMTPEREAQIGCDHLPSSLKDGGGNNASYTIKKPEDNSRYVSVINRQSRDSAVACSGDDEEDMENDTAEPISPSSNSLSRTKSCTSAETGFQTGSERGDERSIPRIDDSGNEKETEYSPFDSDSDFTTSCVEEALSPAGIHLIGSMSTVMGIPPAAYRPALTPKEKNILAPLHLEGQLSLTVSDCDTDIDDATFRSKKKKPPSFKLPKSSESEPYSGASTPKWYKSTTPSETDELHRAYDIPLPQVQICNGSYATSPNRCYGPTTATFPSTAEPPAYQNPPEFKPRAGHGGPPHQKRGPPIRKNSFNAKSPLAYSHKYENMTMSAVTEPQRDIPSSLKHPSSIMPPPGARYPPPPSPYGTSMGGSHTTPSSPAVKLVSGEGGGGGTGSPSFASRSSYSWNTPPVEFKDLKSMSSINPISYWEMQSRMKTSVDQVDPYQILSEPYMQFEDSTSGTQPMCEVADEMDGPEGAMLSEHREFSSQGGGEATADVLDLTPTHVDDNLSESNSTSASASMGKARDSIPITHFPSADCSEEYHSPSLGTLVPSSGEPSPVLSNGFIVASSQQPFDV